MWAVGGHVSQCTDVTNHRPTKPFKRYTATYLLSITHGRSQLPNGTARHQSINHSHVGLLTVL